MGSYFQVLGVPASCGRAIEPSDDNGRASLVAVLGNAYWQRRFAGSTG